ncbi:F-box protein SKIP22 [Cardamine amara subsp. amara]|uniref:F-box protein SKIP22 n=1 Tax=Cardamine amara subsp. amara TaxID=228776 RepID=A0ABD0ZML9_CARAN
MKLRLRRYENTKTLELEVADTCTLHDLRQQINASAPFSVYLSLNREDELLAPSPENTLRSLGITSGDLVYYSLDHSNFDASVQENTLAFLREKHQILETEESTWEDWGMDGLGPMDVELAVAGNKKLSEPFFLKHILLEKSGDTSELTTIAMSVHAVMLESGFVLFNHDSDKFRFSNELLSVSLKYTLPEKITSKETNTIEYVTVNFQPLSYMVIVYGSVGGFGYSRRRVSIDKSRFLPVIDLVMNTLKSDKEGSSSIYNDVLMFWRMVKDGIVIPLLIGLCDEAGLELPPCFMRLPTDLKMKILELLPGVSVAKMACLCRELRSLVASNNDLWKQKCLEEFKNRVVIQLGVLSVDWKEQFAAFWRKHQQERLSIQHRQFLCYDLFI